jgi:putative membrane protein
MRPVTLIIVIAVVIVAGVILVNAARNNSETVDTMNPALVPESATTLAPTDVTFLTRAAESGSAEIQMAQLAQSESDNSRVDALAERIERDHSQANDRLEELAERKDVDFPDSAMGIPGPTEAHDMTHDRLEDLEGAAFDRAWAEQMVKDHQQAVDLFTKASQSADPDVRTFAESTLPTLKEHLQASQDLQKELAGAGATSNR